MNVKWNCKCYYGNKIILWIWYRLVEDSGKELNYEVVGIWKLMELLDGSGIGFQHQFSLQLESSPL